MTGIQSDNVEHQGHLECEEYDSEDGLRQGDIFFWDDASATDMWHQQGVVLTADCDIVHNKSPKFLNYLPIISLDDYINSFWAIDELNRLARSWVPELSKSIDGLRKKFRPELGKLDQAFVEEEIIRRKPAEDILADFKVEEPHATQKFLELCSLRLDIIQKLVRLDENEIDFDARNSLLQAYKFQAKATKNDPRQSLHQRLGNHLSNLSGDLFYIHKIPYRGWSGNIVMLRYIYQIEHARIRPTWGIAQRDGATCYRVGCLKSPFLYFMTRKLASIFADIGLPPEYDNRRKSLPELICNSMNWD